MRLMNMRMESAESETSIRTLLQDDLQFSLSCLIFK